jgi:hypothetical protein
VHYFPLPFAITATITRKSWRLLGMWDHFSNDSQAHKQEDELVMKFLRKISNLNDEIERFELFFCLRPWVLLKHAIFVEEYSRTQRTTFLSFGFAIILMHFLLLIEQKRRRVHEATCQGESPTLEAIKFSRHSVQCFIPTEKSPETNY